MSVTPERFAAALKAAEQWSLVRLDASQVDRILGLATDGHFRRDVARARKFAAGLTSADLSAADGESLAILTTAYIALTDGARRICPSEVPAGTRRFLYTCCVVLEGAERGHTRTRVLRTIATIDALGPHALSEVSRRFEQNVGAWVGAWRLQADAGDGHATESLARLRRAAKSYAARQGNDWLASAQLERVDDPATEALNDALTMALAELVGGKVYPVAAQAMADALDGKLNLAHIRAANRSSGRLERMARVRKREVRWRTVDVDIDRPDVDPIEQVPARTESPERISALRPFLAAVQKDPRLSVALEVLLSDEPYELAAARHGVTARTIQNWVGELRRVAGRYDTQPHAPSRRGRRPKPG